MKNIWYILIIPLFVHSQENGIIGTISQGDSSITIDPIDAIPFPELKVFVSATGYGRYAGVGQPARTVRLVSNLSDSGAGSLRAAATQANSDVVFFGLNGNIQLNSLLIVAGNVRIHGQTGNIAITSDESDLFSGPLIRLNNSDSMIRYLRIRRKGEEVSSNSGGGGFLSGNDYMFDHVTFSWMSDDMTGAAFNGGSNATYQYCLFYESVPKSTSNRGTGKGVLFYNDLRTLSLRGIVTAHVGSRNPAVKANILEMKLEMMNNIFYNYSSQGGSIGVANGGGTQNDIGTVKANVISNKYIVGGNAYNSGNHYSLRIYRKVNLFLKDNIGRYRETNTGPEWDLIGNNDSPLTAASKIYSGFDREALSPHIMNYTVDDAVPIADIEDEILPIAGAYIYQDTEDARIIDEIDTRTGETYDPADPTTFVYPTLGAGPSFTDANSNWIDDSFETEHGLSGDGTNVTVEWEIAGDDWQNNTGWTDRDVYFGVLANDFELYKSQEGL